LLPALQRLLDECLLAKEHKIYFEVEKKFDLSQLPTCWTILKNQVAGQVRYGLLQHCDELTLD
jgi:16S rRNA G966 N2-methylase RsmD